MITAGSSGIGAALARRLAAAGTSVIVANLNIDGPGDQFASTIRFVHVDVSKPNDIEMLFSLVEATYPSLDLVLDCAGICSYGEASTFSGSQWEREISVNLVGTINVSLATYATMETRGGNVIANLSSMSVFLQPPMFAPYVTSKAGILAFSRALAIEGERHRIQVSVVCSGNVRTPLLGAWKQSCLTPAISADDPALRILSALARGRRIIVFPLYARIFWYLDRLSPRLLNPLRRAKFRKLSFNSRVWAIRRSPWLRASSKLLRTSSIIQCQPDF
jgi:NAD(P)-dependent dehydrogenase (short-subunit alcohol dehydrogenase family)